MDNSTSRSEPGDPARRRLMRGLAALGAAALASGCATDALTVAAPD